MGGSISMFGEYCSGAHGNAGSNQCLNADNRMLVSRRRSWISWDLRETTVAMNNHELLSDQRPEKIMCCNGSSSVASLFTKQGQKGVNQDAMILWQGFCWRKDTVLCGVFDGHGSKGHRVARTVRDSLPSKLQSEWLDAIRSCKSPTSCTEQYQDKLTAKLADSRYNDSDDCGYGLSLKSLDETKAQQVPEELALWQEAFLKAYKEMDKELQSYPSVDCSCSGTTAMTIIKQGKNLVIGNVGDSRAVLATRGENGELLAVQLTVDLKPNLPHEAERIKQCKGRVFAMLDEPDVHRLWQPDGDSPGLAVARAFGDLCMKEFGLIAVPDISYRRLTDADEFIVLATDGIWDVLSNQEVVEIISGAPSKGAAARCVVKCATQAWKRKRSSFKADDCTVVCLFLDDELH